MKKLLILLSCVMMIFTLVSCGKEEVKEEETQTTVEETVTDVETDSDKKVLILYFSATGEQYTVGVIEEGNTAIVAKMIAEKTGGDLFEIIPEDDHYPKTYDELLDVARSEQSENARPAFKGELPDTGSYDAVFIGSPVWWGDYPMIMYTALESVDFNGKTLIPFSTHEGSGLSGFDRKLESLFPDAQVLEGLAIRGNDAQNKQDDVSKSVDNWLSGLNY